MIPLFVCFAFGVYVCCCCSLCLVIVVAFFAVMMFGIIFFCVFCVVVRTHFFRIHLHIYIAFSFWQCSRVQNSICIHRFIFAGVSRLVRTWTNDDFLILSLSTFLFSTLLQCVSLDLALYARSCMYTFGLYFQLTLLLLPGLLAFLLILFIGKA